MSGLAAVVLAAGSGTRLRPLTELRAKALCPINNVALIDHAIDHVADLVDDVYVNAWHHADQILMHVDGRFHVEVETEPLGTAGAVANLRSRIDGRGVVVHNSDAWHSAAVRQLVEGWDGEHIRLLVQRDEQRADFDDNLRFAGVSLMPWSEVKGLKLVPSGLWEVSWRQAIAEHRVEFVPYDGTYFDCGTPADYLEANLAANDGHSVVAPDATVLGRVEESVLWSGARVDEDEVLRRSIRAPGMTVDAGRAP